MLDCGSTDDGSLACAAMNRKTASPLVANLVEEVGEEQVAGEMAC